MLVLWGHLKAENYTGLEVLCKLGHISSSTLYFFNLYNGQTGPEHWLLKSFVNCGKYTCNIKFSSFFSVQLSNVKYIYTVVQPVSRALHFVKQKLYTY